MFLSPAVITQARVMSPSLYLKTLCFGLRDARRFPAIVRSYRAQGFHIVACEVLVFMSCFQIV